MKKVEREAVIQTLLDDDLDISSIMDRVSYFCDILRDGFKGYANYSNKELKKEYEERFSLCLEEKITVTGRK